MAQPLKYCQFDSDGEEENGMEGKVRREIEGKEGGRDKRGLQPLNIYPTLGSVSATWYHITCLPH